MNPARGRARTPTEKLQRDLSALRTDLARHVPGRVTGGLEAAVSRFEHRLGPARVCPACGIVWGRYPTTRLVRFRQYSPGHPPQATCPADTCPDCR